MKNNKILSIFNNLNKPDQYGLTRLYRAARHGDVPRVRDLLKKGADPNVKTGCGLSALHIAAYWGEVKIIEMLLAAGANPNATNNSGWTPLHSASVTAGLNGRKKVIEILKTHKADIHAKDSNGWTPLDYASLWDNPDDPQLAMILKHLQTDKTELSGHQPDIKKLGICRHPKGDSRAAKNDNCSQKKKKCIKKGQIPPHYKKNN